MSIVCRRAWRLAAVLGAPWLLAGCIHLSGKSPSAPAGDEAGSPASGSSTATQGRPKPGRRPNESASHDEAVSSILMTQDQQKLVVIGADHHFVFAMPKGFASALKAKFRRVIVAEFGEFRVHADGVVTGNYQLLLLKPDSELLYNAAAAIGFAELGSGDHMRMLGRLHGVRYYANGVTAPASRAKLGAPYRVKVIIEPGAGEAAGKAATTPVATSADGGLTIARTPLVAIGLAVAASNCVNKKCGPGG